VPVASYSDVVAVCCFSLSPCTRYNGGLSLGQVYKYPPYHSHASVLSVSRKVSPFLPHDSFNMDI